MSFDGITRTALERATASIEGARHIGSQLSGYAGTNVQTLLEAIIGRVLPSGGTTGQALTKSSNTDYAVGWTTASGGSPPFADNTALVKDDADATKLIRVDAGTVATGTTRVLTMPNADVNLAALTNSNIDAAAAIAETKLNLASDAAAGTASRRTLGTGATQAAAGNDARFANFSIRDWAFSGTLATTTGTMRVPIHATGTITSIRAMVNTAPTGASIIIDVNKNGTTMYTTQGNRPTIAISGNSVSATLPDVTSLAAGDYLTVDIDQVGSTISGANLVVSVRYSY